jgi:origin recognition complex subunit 5
VLLSLNRNYKLDSHTDIVNMLISKFPSLSTSSDDILTDPYHPSLSSLYTHFINMVCDVCYPFSHDPRELQYIAAARWVGFIKPILDDYKCDLDRREEGNGDEEMDVDDIGFIPPLEDLRIRLLRFFNPSLTMAMEALLPRQTNATDWALANEPPDNLLAMTRAEIKNQERQAPTAQANGLVSLPRMSKYILIASFLASMNPARSDLRMFGRGLDEKKRKRRVTKTERKTKPGVVAKVWERFFPRGSSF